MGITVGVFFLSEILIIDLSLTSFLCLILLRPQFSDCVIKFAHIVMDCDIYKQFDCCIPH